MLDLQKDLSGLPNNSGWISDYFVTKHYCKQAEYIYNHLKPEYIDRPIKLIVIGISPLATDTVGGGRPKTHDHILKAPDFEIIKMKRNQFYSIGSGSTVGIYFERLNNLNSDVYNNSLIQMEVSHNDGYGIAVSHYIRSIVSDNPPEGGTVSIITAFIYRGEVKIEIRTTRRIKEDGTLTENDTPAIFQN